MTRAILILFTLSGMCALVYQLAWTRWLGLLLGTFATATATVVSTFMAGLAIGNALFGRAAARRTPAGALKMYALLEALLAVFALASPFLFASSSPLHPLLAKASGHALLRAGICFVLLLPPTIMMGGTLPALVRTLSACAPAALGPLYALNTIGGALGPLLAAFVIMPAVGIIRTVVLIGLLNAGIAACAFLIARKMAWNETGGAEPSPDQPVIAENDPSPPGIRVPDWIPYALAAVSGFVALGLEIGLTRLIILTVTGGSIYGFAIILSAFLTGIALGAWLLKSFPPAGARGALLAFGVAQGAIWLFSMTTPFWDVLPPLLVKFWWTKPDFGTLAAINFTLVLCLLLVMTTASGYALPALAASLRRADSETIGRLFAANTLGAVAGSALTGFVLLMTLGLAKSLLALGGLALLASAFALVLAMPKYRLEILIPVPLLLALPFALPEPDRSVMNAGMYNRPHGFKPKTPYDRATPQEAAHRLGTIVYQKDSLTGRISVRRASMMQMAFVVNGKPDGSTSLVDMYTQVMMGHLPILMHPDPKRVLVIGLGTGTTTGCLTLHPEVNEIHVAEIEPAQIDVARWFQHHNHNAIANTKVRIHLDDARRFLLTDRRKYDVIVSEPSNLYVSGMVNLFTQEFYRTIREHLTPGGVFFQWIHYYRVRPDDIRGMLATFTSVFPQTTFWVHEYGDAFMMGRDGDFRIDIDGWEKRLENPALTKDLRRIQMSPPLEVLRFFLWGPEDINRYAAGGRICTDDFPYLEFTTPRQSYNPSKVTEIRIRMQSHGPLDPVPLAGESLKWRLWLGDTFFSAGNVNRARREYQRAIQISPDSAAARKKLADLEALLKTAPAKPRPSPEPL